MTSQTPIGMNALPEEQPFVSTAAPSNSSPGTDAKQSWAQRAVHHITLHSGMEVDIRIPDMGALIAADAVPDHLRGAVLQRLADDINTVIDDQGETAAPGSRRTSVEELEKAMKTGAEINDWLVTYMLVEPRLTMEDMLPDSPTRPPEEDLELLVQIAQRERDTDARGVRLGVEPLDRLGRFRHHHGCTEDCASCRAWADEVSTRGMGNV
jgi:hypothetical protein